MLKKADDFHSAMLIYRKTPPQGHTYSPSQCMLLRRTRTPLPTTDQLLTLTMLNFRIVEEEITKKRHDSKTYYDKSASVEQGPLIIGTYAYTKPPPHQRGKPWIYGKVINRENPRSTSQTSDKFFYLSASTKSHWTYKQLSWSCTIVLLLSLECSIPSVMVLWATGLKLFTQVGFVLFFSSLSFVILQRGRFWSAATRTIIRRRYVVVVRHIECSNHE